MDEQLYCIIKVDSVDFLGEKISYNLFYISTKLYEIENLYNRIRQDKDDAKEYILYKYSKDQRIAEFLRERYFGVKNTSLILECLKAIKKNNLDLPKNLNDSPRIGKFT